jgi:hypothetical protein
MLVADDLSSCGAQPQESRRGGRGHAGCAPYDLSSGSKIRCAGCTTAILQAILLRRLYLHVIRRKAPTAPEGVEKTGEAVAATVHELAGGQVTGLHARRIGHP